MSKLWAGRTSGEVSSIADDFNSSIRFDCKLYKQDITGSMAHAAMLGAQGIISQAEAGQLIDGLQGILSDLESGALEFDFGCEDIHMFVEQVLTQRLGDVGKKLHTARSRNDQVALDLRMYLKDQIDEITALVKDVLGAIVAQAENNKGVIMPGYTHLQRAQPILFSHHLMAYAMMLLRDLGRLGDCRKRMNVCPIGSCALAGTTYPTDRRFEAAKLGFDEGEFVVSVILTNDYSGMLLFVYENGKVAKVPLQSYATKTNRKKLANAYSDKSPLVTALPLPEEQNVLLRSSGNRALLFQTEELLPKTARNTQGVQVMTLKGKQVVLSAELLTAEQAEERKRYQAKTLPALGALAKDLPDVGQMTLA